MSFREFAAKQMVSMIKCAIWRSVYMQCKLATSTHYNDLTPLLGLTVVTFCPYLVCVCVCPYFDPFDIGISSLHYFALHHFFHTKANLFVYNAFLLLCVLFHTPDLI